MNGRRICGYANGASYKDAVLPEKTERETICPEGYKPCIPNFEQSFCYSIDENAEEVCPITDIKFVKKTATNETSHYRAKGYKQQEMDDEYTMFFSQKQDSLPVTKLEIGPKPCLGASI